MYYCIKRDDVPLGYIGFNRVEDEDVLESEIYIFQDYRGQGVGSRVLRGMVEKAFCDGLPSFNRELYDDNPLFSPSRIISPVRVEDEPSRKLVEKSGFSKNKNAVMAVRLIKAIDSEDIIGSVEVTEYSLSKEELTKN